MLHWSVIIALPKKRLRLPSRRENRTAWCLCRRFLYNRSGMYTCGCILNMALINWDSNRFIARAQGYPNHKYLPFVIKKIRFKIINISGAFVLFQTEKY